VLELRILDGHPLRDFLTGLVLAGNLFDIIQLRDWLLWFLGGLQFLILFNYRVSLLQLGQLVLNLILGEGETPDHLKQGQ